MKIVCGSLWKVVKTKGQILFIEEKVAVNVLPTNELFHPGDERKRKERRRDARTPPLYSPSRRFVFGFLSRGNGRKIYVNTSRNVRSGSSTMLK